ncbi:hypothetical protein B0H16DRAFT_1723245 [Mycena metata]|uniref:Uncharacterized protein n=1 Tax=Mycena metata TaxID=1033252 RepID=A0AAD7IYH8_9AGAR|nr:hypothetical protein B0H16DRAFT_1723245 [Mycena metata]
MERIPQCTSLTRLCIRIPIAIPDGADLRPPRLGRFGASLIQFAPALTHFDLPFEMNIPLDFITDIISSLPRLTHLRICTPQCGILPGGAPAPAPPLAVPPNLHELEISVRHGAGLLFKWFLSHREPPVFTYLSLAGHVGDLSHLSLDYAISPIDIYFRRFGAQIISLSLAFWVEEFARLFTLLYATYMVLIPPAATQAFEYRVFASTTQLQKLSLARQYTMTVPTTLRTLMQSSTHLSDLAIEVRTPSDPPLGCLDWAVIDALLASPHYECLRHFSLTNWISKKSILTADFKLMMPQAAARQILHHE